MADNPRYFFVVIGCGQEAIPMETTNNPSILNKPLTQLGLSAEFLEMANLNRFSTLEDILKEPADALLKRSGFGYRMLKELTGLLERDGLLHLLKET
jgi:hypothetical protein